ncbi:MAG TPA: LCP family protein [Mobilitalea sp.]|nr:LCP family protein [Mobilitalea sp.]
MKRIDKRLKTERFNTKTLKTKKQKIRKIIIIAVSILLSIVLFLCTTSYMVVHSYLSKMNFVTLEEESYALAESVSSKGNENLEDVGYDISPEDYVEDEHIGESIMSVSDREFDISEDKSTTLAEAELDERVNKSASNLDDNLIENNKVLNILLIGTDNYSDSEHGRSDTMMLISINKKAETIIATSLLRDIYLQIPGGKNNRLNSAYSKGGAKLLIETIESNFKIKIDKFASVDFYSFIDIVDTIGGITLEVTEEELPIVNDYINQINTFQDEEWNTDALQEAGIVLLNGKQALSYSRVRYVGTDFGRTARQRLVLELIFEKAKKLSYSQINDLMQMVLPKITTNFSEKELFTQILSLPDYLEYGLKSWSIPMKGTYKNVRIRGMEVLEIDFEKNIKELIGNIY